MYATLIFVLAVMPAFLLGWFMPSIFILFGSDIEAPLDKRTSVLALLLLPWMVGAGWWMLWLIEYEDGRIGIDASRAMLLATFVACLSTSLRRRFLPLLVKTLRDWFERLDKWLYTHTP